MGPVSCGPKAECSKSERGSVWLQHGEKAGRAAHDKDGEAGMSLVHTAYFLVTGGKSVDFILSAVGSFWTDTVSTVSGFVD